MRIFPLNQEPLYYLSPRNTTLRFSKGKSFQCDMLSRKKKKACWENVVLYFLIHLIFPSFDIYFFLSPISCPY